MQKRTRGTTYFTGIWSCLFTIGLLLLLTACGSAVNNTTTGSPSAPTATAPAPTPTPDTSGTPTATPSGGGYGYGHGGTTPTPAPTTPASGPTKSVTIPDGGTFTFSPASLTIPVGTTVVWHNNSSAPHTATSNDGSTFNGSIDPQGTYSFKFTKAGTYAYHCSIHPYMTATIIVK